MIYIWIIPESVIRKDGEEEVEDEDVDLNANEVEKVPKKPKKNLWRHFVDTNKLFITTIKYIFRYQKIVWSSDLYLLSVFNVQFHFPAKENMEKEA